MIMDLDIRGVKYELADELERHIERRLRSALGRFAGRIERVLVRIADVNGPRGGVDKRCRLTIALVPRGVVRLEDAGHDPYILVARVAKRAGQNVRRALLRRRRKRAFA